MQAIADSLCQKVFRDCLIQVLCLEKHCFRVLKTHSFSSLGWQAQNTQYFSVCNPSATPELLQALVIR